MSRGSTSGGATAQERRILAFLECASGPLDRAELAARIWPGVPPQQARARLRQRLHHLERAMPGRLRKDRETVALDMGGSFSETELRAWVRARVVDGSVAHPYPDRAAGLLAHGGPLACVAAAAVGEDHMAITLAVESAPGWRGEDGALCLGLARELAGNAAHREGDCMAALAFFEAAGADYGGLGHHAAAARLGFKFARTRVDMGAVRGGRGAMERIAAEFGRELPASVRWLMNANLVFAQAVAGDAIRARATADRLRRDDIGPLAALNESTLLLAEGRSGEAARQLVSLFSIPLSETDRLLAWLRATEVLGAAGRAAAAWGGLAAARRLAHTARLAISPVNLGRATAAADRTAAGLASSERLRVWSESRSDAPEEAHARLEEALSAVARGRV